ncbi:MAG: hypothetical protein OEV43_06140 [Coriobacteriia bacterium]|nr:hypothetical protein [Coriobacteriia bacterium]
MEMAAGALDARTLERKAWNRVFNDGLWDLYLGALFVNVAAWTAAGELGSAWGETAVPAMGFLIVFLGAFRAAKSRITKPRIGHFQIERARTKKVHLAASLALAVTVILVGVTFVAGMGAFPEGIPLVAIMFGVTALGVSGSFSLAAYSLGVQRFYVYGALAAVGYVGAEVLAATSEVGRGWDIVGVFGLPAIVMLPLGLLLLRRFLQEHPVVTDSGPDA